MHKAYTVSDTRHSYPEINAIQAAENFDHQIYKFYSRLQPLTG